MHTIQTRRIPPVQNPRSSRRLRDRKGSEALPRWNEADRNLTGVMLLEYCKRGSLHKALCVLDAKKIQFPERALWHMFHCRESSPQLSCHGVASSFATAKPFVRP